MRREYTLEESEDPSIDVAVNNLIRVLTDRGIYAREISISVNNLEAPPRDGEEIFHITLDTLTEPNSISPDYPGLTGIMTFIDIDEEDDSDE